MKSIFKVAVSATILFSSSYSMADQFNHGNHNDPLDTFGTNSVNTVSCGSSSLAVCISNVNLEGVSSQWCKNKVVDVSDGILQWGKPYYHTVQSYGLHIVSATDNGSSSNNYSVDLQYSCQGLVHGMQLFIG